MGFEVYLCFVWKYGFEEKINVYIQGHVGNEINKCRVWNHCRTMRQFFVLKFLSNVCGSYTG